MSIEERALINQIRAGNPQAFHLLYEGYADRVAGFALRLSGSRSEAEDIVQEVFLAAYAGRENFAGRSRLLTWLLGIATRRWRDRCRQKPPAALSLSDENVPDENEINPGASGVSARGDVENTVIDALTLNRALSQLEPRFREALLLVASQGLTYREAAEVMEEPVGTVKWRVYQATRTMAGLLHAVEDEFYEMQQASSGTDTLPCRP